LASIDMTLGNLAPAEKRLFTLKETYKNEMDIYEMLSALRLKQKRYQDVISESEKASDLGFSQTLLFNRAIAFEKLRQFQRLDEVLGQILDKRPNDTEVLNFYGYSLADRGIRLSEALNMVEKALKEKPNDGYYLDSLAWVYFKQEEYKKALENQLNAIEVVPNDAVMMEHLGDIYWRLNDVERAKASWQKALRFNHDEPEKMKNKIEHGLM